MDTQITEKQKNTYIRKMTFVGIIGNIALTIFKFAAGIIGHSNAMISDAVHSSSDVLGTFAAYVGAKLSDKEADDTHPYGHERLECMASVTLAFLLLVAGILIGYNGVKDIISGNTTEPPKMISVVAAIVSIFVKELMYHYTKHTAKKINSAVFIADAWHHRTDALSSVGALLGIIGAKFGIIWLDSAASVIICLFIIYIAIKIFTDAQAKLVDKACPQAFTDELKELIISCEGVIKIDKIKTRMFGEKVYIDLEISANKHKTLFEAHNIAADIHKKVEEKYNSVKHIMVHINPYIEDNQAL